MELFQAPAKGFLDFVQRIEGGVAKRGVPQVVPDMLDRIEFRAIGGQRDQPQSVGNRQGVRPVPTGTVKYHHADLSSKAACRVTEKHRHGVGVHPGHH